MSGLCGIFDFGGNILTRHFETMLFMLTHRGRGDPGVWRDESLCFGFWDLKALDEERRFPQPFRDEKENVRVMFDGRLDNRKELLEKLGWQNATDVELVAGGYGKWNENVFRELLGDFALALWDGRKEKLILARDPIGLKPLFYYKDSRRFIFASEAKAILSFPDVPRAPDEKFLRAFDSARLREHVPTFFAGISRVRPGEIVTVSRDGVFHHQYWKPDISIKIKRRPDEDVQSEFKKIFYSAVKARLPEKGKAAVFLSGGLDSSSVTSAAADIVRKEKMPVDIETFSMISNRFPDERKYSDCVTQAHGLSNATVNIDELDLTGTLEKLVFEFESPFVGPHDIFFGALLEKAAQSGAKVLFTGEWGDQLMFSGAYLADIILEGRWGKFLKEFPLFCRYEQAPVLFVLKRIFWYLAAPRFHTPKYETRAQKELYESVFYPGNVLIMETMERAAACAGLELRIPFLDLRLFDFLIETPAEQRMKNGIGKMLLRKSLKGILPDRIARRTEKTDYTACLLQRFNEIGARGNDLDEATREWDVKLRQLWAKTWFGKKN